MINSDNPEQITSDFVRSPLFRIVHCNGVFGGLTPRQELSATFLSERGPVPRNITHELTPDGLGLEISRETTLNVRRECEIEVMMSMEEAVNLHGRLGAKIEEWRGTNR